MRSKDLLVGDNPFHNISHLSQERSRLRDETASSPNRAADMVSISLDNGANGFMFSVSETTLSILENLRARGETGRLDLYPIVPYAYEYVRYAAQAGGLLGLAKRLGRQLLSSGNMGAVASGLKGVLRMNPEAIMKTYVAYEISRIKSAAGKDANIKSMLLHEVITDMGLALGLDWLFKKYSTYLMKRDIAPGFNTCNFPFLIDKLEEWNIDVDDVVVATPINQVGFQMNPSREECEKVLARMDKSVTIAISVLAAGYLKLPQAIEYIASLPNIKGVAIGVSKEEHARQTFKFLREKL
jgi:hypothetical protein